MKGRGDRHEVLSPFSELMMVQDELTQCHVRQHTKQKCAGLVTVYAGA